VARRWNLLCCSLLLWPACSAPSEAPAEEPIEAHVTHRPAALVENDAQVPPRSVAVALFALEETPEADSIELHLTAIAAERNAAFRTMSTLPPGTRWLAPSAEAQALLLPPAAEPAAPLAGDGQQLCAADAVVAPGLETRITFTSPLLPAVELRCRGAGIELQLDHEPGDGRGRQRLVVGDTLPEDGPSLLFVPATNPTFAGYAVVIAPGGPADDEEIAAAREAASVETERKQPRMSEQQWLLATQAIGEWNRRTALLAIAQQWALPLAGDVILSADLPGLVAMVTAVAQLAPNDPDYGWHFQRAIWEALVPAMQRDALSPALYACLLRQLGSLAIHPAGLRMDLRSSKSLTEFTDKLRIANLEALDDRDPVPRVRAHDWLVHRGHAVPGYEPLADAASRRSALRQHEAAANAAAGGAAGGAQ
jgi:hypothetical protein